MGETYEPALAPVALTGEFSNCRNYRSRSRCAHDGGTGDRAWSEVEGVSPINR